MRGAAGMRRRAGAVLLLLGLAMGAGACAPALRGYSGDDVRLFVANEGSGSVLVTVQQDGASRELGSVDRFQYRFFTLHGGGTVVVSATPDQGRPLVTDSIRLAPGRVLDVRLGIPPQRLQWSYY